MWNYVNLDLAEQLVGAGLNNFVDDWSQPPRVTGLIVIDLQYSLAGIRQTFTQISVESVAFAVTKPVDAGSGSSIKALAQPVTLRTGVANIAAVWEWGWRLASRKLPELCPAAGLPTKVGAQSQESESN